MKKEDNNTVKWYDNAGLISTAPTNSIPMSIAYCIVYLDIFPQPY